MTDYFCFVIKFMNDYLLSVYGRVIERILNDELPVTLTFSELVTYYSMYSDLYALIDVQTFARTIARLRRMQHKLCSFADRIDAEMIYVRSPDRIENFVVFYETNNQNLNACRNKLVQLFDCLSYDCQTVIRYATDATSELERLDDMSTYLQIMTA